MLVGKPAGQGSNYYGSTFIHNGYLQIFLRFGIFSGIAFLVFWVVLLYRALGVALSDNKKLDKIRPISTIVVLICISIFLAGLFNDWRNVLLYGIGMGVWFVLYRENHGI